MSLMDWHYHKDDTYTDEQRAKDDDMHAWQQAGFKITLGSIDFDETLECPHCAAIVSPKNWRKHLESLHPIG